MCIFKTPKPPALPPTPPMPAVYNPTQTEVVSPEGLEANLREKRRRMALAGRQSTMIAGLGGSSKPATTGAKTLLGS